MRRGVEMRKHRSAPVLFGLLGRLGNGGGIEGVGGRGGIGGSEQFGGSFVGGLHGGDELVGSFAFEVAGDEDLQKSVLGHDEAELLPKEVILRGELLDARLHGVVDGLLVVSEHLRALQDDVAEVVLGLRVQFSQELREGFVWAADGVGKQFNGGSDLLEIFLFFHNGRYFLSEYISIGYTTIIAHMLNFVNSFYGF